MDLLMFVRQQSSGHGLSKCFVVRDQKLASFKSISSPIPCLHTLLMAPPLLSKLQIFCQSHKTLSEHTSVHFGCIAGQLAAYCLKILAILFERFVALQQLTCRCLSQFFSPLGIRYMCNRANPVQNGPACMLGEGCSRTVHRHCASYFRRCCVKQGARRTRADHDMLCVCCILGCLVPCSHCQALCAAC